MHTHKLYIYIYIDGRNRVYVWPWAWTEKKSTKALQCMTHTATEPHIDPITTPSEVVVGIRSMCGSVAYDPHHQRATHRPYYFHHSRAE